MVYVPSLRIAFIFGLIIHQLKTNSYVLKPVSAVCTRFRLLGSAFSLSKPEVLYYETDYGFVVEVKLNCERPKVLVGKMLINQIEEKK